MGWTKDGREIFPLRLCYWFIMKYAVLKNNWQTMGCSCSKLVTINVTVSHYMKYIGVLLAFAVRRTHKLLTSIHNKDNTWQWALPTLGELSRLDTISCLTNGIERFATTFYPPRQMSHIIDISITAFCFIGIPVLATHILRTPIV